MAVGNTRLMREPREPCFSHSALRAGTSRALQVRARETVDFGLIARIWVAMPEANSSSSKTRAVMAGDWGGQGDFVAYDSPFRVSHFFGPDRLPRSPLSAQCQPEVAFKLQYLQPAAEKSRLIWQLAAPFARWSALTERIEGYGEPPFTAGLCHSVVQHFILQKTLMGAPTANPRSRIELV